MLGGSWDRLPRPPRAVLFDRDGTLVVDVPYNADPARVEAMPGAAALLDDLRAAGVKVGLISNQSGVGRGLITPAQLEAVTDRVRELLGPFDVVRACPHLPEDGCACRKPAPGMIRDACGALDVEPADTVMVGDIGADVDAAAAAGAHGVLVPTPITRPEEVAAAPLVAGSLDEVARRLLPAAAPTGSPASVGAR